MNILRRGVPAVEEAGKQGVAEATVNRRIEVTVERETVTMLVRSQPKVGREEPAGGCGTPESGRPQLQPSRLALKERFETCPACGSRNMVLLAEALPGLDTTLLRQGDEGSVHLHLSPSGEWWICQQSFHGK
jgi:hypothetical protein